MSQNSIYHDDLMCEVISISVDRKGEVILRIAELNSANFPGTLKLAQSLNPECTRVTVYSGRDLDIVYRKKGNKWESFDQNEINWTSLPAKCRGGRGSKILWGLSL